MKKIIALAAAPAATPAAAYTPDDVWTMSCYPIGGAPFVVSVRVTTKTLTAKVGDRVFASHVTNISPSPEDTGFIVFAKGFPDGDYRYLQAHFGPERGWFNTVAWPTSLIQCGPSAVGSSD